MDPTFALRELDRVELRLRELDRERITEPRRDVVGEALARLRELQHQETSRYVA